MRINNSYRLLSTPIPLLPKRYCCLQLLQPFFTPRKVIQWPESGKFLLVESGILGFELQKSNSRNSRCHKQLEFRIQVPLTKSTESSTWNPESSVWNPEFKTVLDHLTLTFLKDSTLGGFRVLSVLEFKHQKLLN